MCVHIISLYCTLELSSNLWGKAFGRPIILSMRSASGEAVPVTDKRKAVIGCSFPWRIISPFDRWTKINKRTQIPGDVAQTQGKLFYLICYTNNNAAFLHLLFASLIDAHDCPTTTAYIFCLWLYTFGLIWLISDLGRFVWPIRPTFAAHRSLILPDLKRSTSAIQLEMHICDKRSSAETKDMQCVGGERIFRKL